MRIGTLILVSIGLVDGCYEEQVRLKKKVEIGFIWKVLWTWQDGNFLTSKIASQTQMYVMER